jgi:8-oxo-dGTP diphosphatase
MSMSETPILRTAAGLLVRDGRVLLGFRAGWKPAWPNHWDAIGGRLEPGETPEQALRREIREEVGVEVDSIALLCEVTNPASANGPLSTSSIYAVLSWTGGDPANVCDEHSEIAWFTPAEIAGLDHLAGHSYPALALQAVELADMSETGQ